MLIKFKHLKGRGTKFNLEGRESLVSSRFLFLSLSLRGPLPFFSHARGDLDWLYRAKNATSLAVLLYMSCPMPCKRPPRGAVVGGAGGLAEKCFPPRRPDWNPLSPNPHPSTLTPSCPSAVQTSNRSNTEQHGCDEAHKQGAYGPL